MWKPGPQGKTTPPYSTPISPITSSYFLYSLPSFVQIVGESVSQQDVNVRIFDNGDILDAWRKKFVWQLGMTHRHQCETVVSKYVRNHERRRQIDDIDQLAYLTAGGVNSNTATATSLSEESKAATVTEHCWAGFATASPRWTLAQPNQKSFRPKEVYGSATVREGVPVMPCVCEFVSSTLG